MICWFNVQDLCRFPTDGKEQYKDIRYIAYIKTYLDKLKGEWFEIQYADRNEKYTRIIRVNNIYEVVEDEGRRKRFLEANCLLRYGRIRNFKVSGLKGYRKLSEDFSKTFLS